MVKSVAALLPCVLVGVLTGVAGCSSGPTIVTKDDVEKQIADKMRDAQGNEPESVSCPQDLQPKVGATVTCTMQFDGRPVDVVVTVTSIDGDNVNFDMVSDIFRNGSAPPTG